MENPIKMDDLGKPLFWKHPDGTYSKDVPHDFLFLSRSKEKRSWPC